MSARLRDERGIAMPVAIAVLLLCMILTVMAAEGADRLTRTSSADQHAKRALAAADAGLSVATRRLRSLTELGDGDCLTDTGVPPGSGGAAPGECPSYTEELGGGASFSYTVTPVSTAPAGCYEVPGTAIVAGWFRRCITATGRVGEQVKRVQAQVVMPPPGAGHWMGILGLDHVEIRNSAKLSACWSTDPAGPKIGSNLSLSIDNSSILNYQCPAKVWGVEMPAGKTPSIHGDAQPKGAIPITTAPAPYAIPDPPLDFEVVEHANANGNVSGYPGSSVSWSPGLGARSLSLGNGGSITFTQGGDYSFCTLALDNSSSIDFSTTQRTRIFIDSPSRPGSNCGSSTGFAPQNGSRFNWPVSVSDTNIAALDARARNVEVYVWGSDVTIRNSVRLAALVQAERNTIHYVNGSLTWGAVAARRVILENSGNFQRPTGLSAFPGGIVPYESAGWAQCSGAPPVPADPESGC